ncbi:MAG: 2-phosphosulfolactate phosphatase family protein [Thermosynechococcaceae cyanobacterium MS004]|nr:2-phosphosulfolactate phosphatase family protein [Thermosynechococcaceae cyanobacterium MS004]
MQFFVYHTPELVPQDRLPDCAIAVDVLRATSTIATVLNAGAEGVQVFSDIQELLTVSEAWDANHRLRVGERGGKTVEGCDAGNSPLECTPERVRDARIFMSTTNGTRALKCIQNAPVVLTAAFINRGTVVQYLQQHQPETVWIVGSGWEGSFSLEDTACAGAVVDGVLKHSSQSLAELAGNDEAIAAVTLFRNFEADLLSLFKHASHGQRLFRLNLLEDLQYCAQTDVLDVLPIQKEKGILGRL